MTTIQAMAGAGVGYVRAVFSVRARGHAVPVDLLRAQLRGAAKVAQRRRLAAAFSGYLVTEQEAEKVWRIDGRIVCITSIARRQGLRPEFEAEREGGIDAPDYLAAGSVLRYQVQAGEVCASDRRVFRAGWYE